MNVIIKRVEDLIPYDRNAKTHDKKQISNVAKSLQKYGIVQPAVIDKNNVIVIGHFRVLAAKKLGLEEFPCVCVDDLTPEQVDELRIVDNKTNESPWDMDLLAEDIPYMDLSDFDFDFNLPEEPKEVEEAPVPDIDMEEPPEAKIGDVYQLGRHRIMCGDSTSVTALEKLSGGVLADLVCTDPPYNMGYQGAGKTPDSMRKRNRILNDKMPDDEFEEFMRGVYHTMYAGMKDDASCYVFYKELGTGVFINMMRESGITFKQELVWVKNALVLGGSNYQNMYEPCLYGCKGKPKWYGGRKNRSVIESVDLMNEKELRQALRDVTEQQSCDVIRENKPLKNDLHPTMKPIKLLARLIRNSTQPGDVVLDLFGGSGSTLMACEQTDRVCHMMELDPKYCDVIRKRWEDFTGEKAVLL